MRVVGGAIGCYVLYGAGSGFFAGGSQIGIAAVEAPLIVASSALLCLPSLYVFGLFAGAPLTRARFVVTFAGFIGMIALVPCRTATDRVAVFRQHRVSSRAGSAVRVLIGFRSVSVSACAFAEAVAGGLADHRDCPRRGVHLFTLCPEDSLGWRLSMKNLIGR